MLFLDLVNPLSSFFVVLEYIFFDQIYVYLYFFSFPHQLVVLVDALPGNEVQLEGAVDVRQRAQQRQFTVRVVRHPTPGLEGRGAGRAPGEGGHFLRFYALRAVSAGSGAQRGAAGSGGSWVASPISAPDSANPRGWGAKARN